MKIIVLGSGTSTGVPILGCTCSVCNSNLPEDKRTRASIFLEKDDYSLLIDSGPDLRFQLLRENIQKIDAVLYTHIHYDHTAGIDDLRSLSQKKKTPLPCYADNFTIETLKKRHPHLQKWKEIPNLPRLDLIALQQSCQNQKVFSSFKLGAFEIQPLRLQHVKTPLLYSIGYVFNKKFAYLTDFKQIKDSCQEYLYNLELMILGSPLTRPHSNHISIPEAIELCKKFQPKKCYIGHLAHDLSHQDLQKQYRTDIIDFSYDGLSLEI